MKKLTRFSLPRLNGYLLRPKRSLDSNDANNYWDLLFVTVLITMLVIVGLAFLSRVYSGADLTTNIVGEYVK